MPRVLIVGSGGREHALARALQRSPQAPELIATPGSPGLARDGVEGLGIGAGDLNAIVAAAVSRRVDFVVVGPEAPLVGGLVDMLGEVGIRAFGPSGAAAHIEGSKAFSKELMKAAGVPTASHMMLRSHEEALAQIPCASYPAVLKADVLAAGKGVIIAANESEARDAVDVFFGERRFGHTTVVLEEFLDGEEVSLFALCDGIHAIPMTPAQDYKRIFDGDEGPNTGGMGSYSPVPGFSDDDAREIARTVHQPICDEMRRRGIPFHGVLYAGLMMTAAGPKVLEFNARFGDPETQAILPRLRSDVLELLDHSARPSGLDGAEIEWSDDWAVTVVLASRGYPESSSSGDVITGIEEAEAAGAEVTHAGTAERDGEIVTAGGRVLNVTALGSSPSEAREKAYTAARMIQFDGMQLRTDIAARAAERVGA